MSKILGKPFKGYRGYKIWNKRQGRFYVCLVPLPNKNNLKRHTITLAKYRLSVSMGRWLKSYEEVDHKNGIKTDDKLSNLQILTSRQNLRKSVIESGRSAKTIKLVCPICRKNFLRSSRLVTFKQKRGKKLKCSRACGYIASSITLTGISTQRLQGILVEEIKRLHAKGLSSYKISDQLKIARNTVMKYW